MGTTAFVEIRVFSKDRDFLEKIETELAEEWKSSELNDYFEHPDFEELEPVADKIFRGKIAICCRDSVVNDFIHLTNKIFKKFDVYTAKCVFTEHDLNDPGTGLLDNIYEAILFQFDGENTCQELDEYIRA